MASFKIAHALTKIAEGGYSLNPNDNGNWTGGKKGVGHLIGTKYGISAPVLREYLNREPTAQDMKDLSRETADKIFWQNYWQLVKGDEIENQDFANQIYDMAVNAGVSNAIKLAECVVGIMPSDAGRMYDDLLNKINNKEA
jgi:lysozyme family protein